jgi:hypothetical protein
MKKGDYSLIWDTVLLFSQGNCRKLWETAVKKIRAPNENCRKRPGYSDD